MQVTVSNPSSEKAKKKKKVIDLTNYNKTLYLVRFLGAVPLNPNDEVSSSIVQLISQALKMGEKN